MSDAIEGSVRATCPRCGTVGVPAAATTLRMTAAGSDDRRSVASFRCPSCGETVEMPVDERTAGLLLTAGVGIGVPSELPSQTDHS